jgi:hypothetical protein
VVNLWNVVAEVVDYIKGPGGASDLAASAIIWTVATAVNNAVEVRLQMFV